MLEINLSLEYTERQAPYELELMTNIHGANDHRPKSDGLEDTGEPINKPIPTICTMKRLAGRAEPVFGSKGELADLMNVIKSPEEIQKSRLLIGHVISKMKGPIASANRKLGMT